jgi:hypothetical protein
MNLKYVLPIVLLASSASCSLPAIKALPPEPGVAAATPMGQPRIVTDQSSSSNQKQANLYDRQGNVVGEQKGGTMIVEPVTGQSSSNEEGTRWTLLEKYQSVLAEKEQLSFELQAITNALRESEERETTAAATVDHLKKQLIDMNGRGEALANQNMELAERLATAQIRRLQSEKLLLEAKLDWRRVQATLMPGEPAGAAEVPVESPATSGPMGDE